MRNGTRSLRETTKDDNDLPEAAIFDLDGKLLDSLRLRAIAWQGAKLEFGQNVRFQQHRSQIGKWEVKLIPVFLTADEQRDYGKDLEEWRGKLFKTCFLRLVPPFSAVPDPLRRVGVRGPPSDRTSGCYAGDIWVGQWRL